MKTYTVRVSIETPDGFTFSLARNVHVFETDHFMMSDLLETKLNEAVADLVAADRPADRENA